MTATTYEFGRRTGVCAASGKVFVPGETYVAALLEKPAEQGEGFERADYSIEAWESSGRPERLFAFWRATMTEGEPQGPRLIDDNELLSLFEQLDGATETKRLAFRYALALILVRKRALVMAGSRKGLLLVQQRVTGPGSVARQATEPVIEVVDPGLDEATINEVTSQLESIMRVGA